MMKNENWRFLLAILAFAAITAATAQCPVYTHKNDVIEGTASSLPNGFMLFTISGKMGIYKSPLRTFDTTRIPGTYNSYVSSVDISDDGQWVVYNQCTQGRSGLTPYATVVTSLDGSRSAILPVYDNLESFTKYPITVGFIHGSPYGMEVYYYETPSTGSRTIRAIQIHTTSDSITFPQMRIVLDLNNGSFRLWPGGPTNITAVVKDQIFGLMGIANGTANPRALLNDFITIPDGGRGTATEADMYQWTVRPDTNLWGCGQTISQDGRYCAANAGYMGDSCVPGKRAIVNIAGDPTDYFMDHKGIYITPFFRKGTTPMAVDDQVLVNGVSINWCPPQYRFGQYSEIDFNEWEFSNDPNYLICRLMGNLAPQYGIFILHWPTNTWTLVTPDAKTALYAGPVMFITDPIGVKKGIGASTRASARSHTSFMKASSTGFISIPAQASTLDIFSLSGTRLWSSSFQPGKTRKISLPGNLIKKACIVKIKQ